MRENDGRKLDHKTLEALRLRAVDQVQQGAHPEDVAAALRIGKAGVVSKDDLKTKATGALRRLQKMPGLIRAFFADPSLRYIAAVS